MLGLFLSPSFAQQEEGTTYTDFYNISWGTMSNDASESMPLVGGDIGCNIWVEDGDILMYIQRSGSLSENGEYLKLGRIRLELDPNPFEDPNSFRQELLLKDGHIEVQADKGGQGTVLRLWVEVDHPVVHMDVDSDAPVSVTASYESWRTEEKELLDVPDGSRARFTCFNLEGYPGKVIRVKDEISHTDHGVLFYHRNPLEKLIPDLLIEQQGLQASFDEINDDIKDRTFGGRLIGEGFEPAGEGTGTYVITPYRSWKIRSSAPGTSHRLRVVTHIDQAATVEDWKSDLEALVQATDGDQTEAFEHTTGWWHDFWDKSWIVVLPGEAQPDNPVWQMGRNYQLFRYQLGGNVFGEYPTKFNGGNLIFDPVLVKSESTYEPDWRQWGGAVFTAQNQRLLYWPMLKAGDFDAMLPQFELYRKGLPGATARVQTHFGHAGAVYSEYTSVPGTALGAGWGWVDGTHRTRGPEVPFGDPTINGLAGYGQPVEKGTMANPYISYHWESQVEHAYMILEYHRFTGADITKYVPFIKSSLIFFDEHYQARQRMRNGNGLDAHGKLVIYPSTSCETYRGAKNPTDLIAGLRACLEGLLNLDEGYLSAAEEEYFNDFLKRIPGYTFGEVEGDQVFQPAEDWLRETNQELPQLYPLFPFNEFNIGDDEIQVFRNTYHHAPESRKGNVVSWHQDGIFFARMGMTEEAADYNTRKLQDSGRRFPTFWGPGHDWVPDHNWGGSGMIGLQEMLMQTIGDQILLFPAWPKEWDVDFKLHAPGNTTVECRLENGEITRLQVVPESRFEDIALIVTGLADIRKEKVVVYPNPAEKQLSIQLSAPVTSETAVKVWDLHGRKVNSGKYFVSGVDTIVLDIGRYERGWYCFQVCLKDTIYFGRFIKE